MQTVKYIYPKINFRGLALMKADIRLRRENGERCTVVSWLRAAADKVNIPSMTLNHIIYNHQSWKGYEEELTKIFYPQKAFTVTWEEVESN